MGARRVAREPSIVLTRVSSRRTLLATAFGSGWLTSRAPPGAGSLLTRLSLPAATRRKNSGSEAQEHAAGAFPASISYRITGQDPRWTGRRLILEIEPAVISACQFGLRTRDTGTINPENISPPERRPHPAQRRMTGCSPAQSAMCVQVPASAD